VWNIALHLNLAAAAISLAAFGYLGTFARHLADDYCPIDLVRGNFFAALWEIYLTISNRFTNYGIIALSEAAGTYSYRFLSGVMIALWVIGLYWLSRELNERGAGWPRSLTLTWILLLAFFSIFEAPSRYQTIYWRSAMVVHFAPVVFAPYLTAFLLREIRLAFQAMPSPWIYPLVFILGFLFGGFSETTNAVQIILLVLALFSAWKWMGSPARPAALRLLAWSLGGALLALAVMFFSPGNERRLGTPPPEFHILILRAFRHAVEFVLASTTVVPLPMFLSIVIPFLIFYGFYARSASPLPDSRVKLVKIALTLTPALVYLLIAASFAPSEYAQSYPIGRARFPAQFLLTAGLMLEGSGLGILLSQWRPRLTRALPIGLIASIMLAVLAFYPVRSAWLTLQRDLPLYAERAEAWDARDAQIRQLKAQGETDLVVKHFGGFQGVKEWEVYPEHWVNRCVAKYYQINTIRTVP